MGLATRRRGTSTQASLQRRRSIGLLSRASGCAWDRNSHERSTPQAPLQPAALQQVDGHGAPPKREPRRIQRQCPRLCRLHARHRGVRHELVGQLWRRCVVGSGQLLAGCIPLNLLFQRRDRSVSGGQLAFNSITPTLEHVELALLVLGMGAVTRFRPAATRERKHGKLVPTRPF